MRSISSWRRNRRGENAPVHFSIPLAVVMLLIQKAKADELDDARDVFAHTRPAVAPAPAESVVYGDDDEVDLDEDDEYEYDSDDDGEEVYDDDEDYDPDDDQDEDDSHGFQMKLW